MRMIGTFNSAKSNLLERIKEEARYIQNTGECITYKKTKGEIEEYLQGKYGSRMIQGEIRKEMTF